MERNLDRGPWIRAYVVVRLNPAGAARLKQAVVSNAFIVMQFVTNLQTSNVSQCFVSFVRFTFHLGCKIFRT